MGLVLYGMLGMARSGRFPPDSTGVDSSSLLETLTAVLALVKDLLRGKPISDGYFHKPSAPLKRRNLFVRKTPSHTLLQGGEFILFDMAMKQ